MSSWGAHSPTGLIFPPGFCWGAATAAYQIEGGWDADGKGPSVWDTLAHRNDGFLSGATGDVACDHYNRLDEDLDLMARLGLTSYRFSVSWPRVQPDGTGVWNAKGLSFYDRLIDGLLSRGIEPALTLYHWDHPQALEEAGGWMSRDTARHFGSYAAGMGERFGDRVARWITVNEPLSVTTGNILGFSRPEGPLGIEGLLTAHHQLLAHGHGVRALREVGVVGEIGITLNFAGVEAASNHPDDVAAADRAEAYEDRLFLDPLLLGSYPIVDGRPVLECTAEDFAVITAPIDFLGVNWYTPARIVHPSRRPPRLKGAQAGADAFEELLAQLPEIFGYARTDILGAGTNVIGWPIAPDHFGAVLSWLRRYPQLPPIYVTENGLPQSDPIDDDGTVHDFARIDYVHRCLAQVHRAVEEGMDIRGYYVWSLLDNLEWALGYGPRFGLIHVDFETQVRTPKDSFEWYRQLISVQRSGQALAG